MKILIIEDDVNYRDNLCKLLEKWQFKLVVAEDFSNIINVELNLDTMPNSLLRELQQYAYSMYKLESEKDIDGYKPKTFNYLSLASDVYRMMQIKGVN